MLIYLLRHGEAGQGAGSDAARELTQTGVVQTRKMLQKFVAREPRIDRALMSPLQRARQTAALVKHVLPAIDFTVDRHLEPDSNVFTLSEQIDQSGAKELLLVGHNPLLTTLLSLLVDGHLQAARPIATSQLYCVELEFYAPGCGAIKYVLEP